MDFQTEMNLVDAFKLIKEQEERIKKLEDDLKKLKNDYYAKNFIVRS